MTGSLPPCAISTRCGRRIDATCLPSDHPVSTGSATAKPVCPSCTRPRSTTVTRSGSTRCRSGATTHTPKERGPTRWSGSAMRSAASPKSSFGRSSVRMPFGCSGSIGPSSRRSPHESARRSTRSPVATWSSRHWSTTSTRGRLPQALRGRPAHPRDRCARPGGSRPHGRARACSRRGRSTLIEPYSPVKRNSACQGPSEWTTSQ